MIKKKLPVGIQSFEEIINDGYLYIDKTKQIYDLITGGKVYFISRPRRFGKSLLCSTLEEIFNGNKELFKGLWIYDSNYDWQSHPVIRIDMTEIAHKSSEELAGALVDEIVSIAGDYNIELGNFKTLTGKFKKLIKFLSKKNKVVIIIDEYDKPILDNIANIEVANNIRDVLRTFYSQFKAQDKYLKFIFITGVTKFSKTSVFSGLNHLYDLTFSKETATFLGYTQKELESNFDDAIKVWAKENKTSKNQIKLKLRHWYNGYSFFDGSKKVYNPFSILSAFRQGVFRNYWFETGTPTFLFHLMKEKCIDHTDPNLFKATESELGNFEIETLPVKTILFQTGYLTISDFNPERNRYFLDYPNYETKESFLSLLANSLTGVAHVAVSDTYFDLIGALKNGGINEFIEILKTFFAQIPYTIQNKNEKYYQTIFFIFLKLIGIQIDVEITTNIGRVDAVATVEESIYIFEFKINKDARAAIKQIKDKKYFQKYMRSGKSIIFVGVNFGLKEKNITDFEVKEL